MNVILPVSVLKLALQFYDSNVAAQSFVFRDVSLSKLGGYYKVTPCGNHLKIETIYDNSLNINSLLFSEKNEKTNYEKLPAE